MPLPDVMLLIHWLVIKLLVAVVSIVAFIAAMDFLYVKFKHLSDQRMSRQDIKDEITERGRSACAATPAPNSSRPRAIAHDGRVPDATVVVTNPTHYSITWP